MNGKTPKVSVIIPTYNRAHLVGRAIRSVLNQTYQDFEIIVVDDGSTDNTEEVVKSFNDPRIRYIRHEKNRGGSAARNTGIRAARSEYIAFLDSDDEWLPEKLEKQVLIFSDDQIGLVYTGRRVIDSRSGRCLSEKIPEIEGDVYKQLLEGDFIGTCSSVMVKKGILEGIDGFDETLPSRQDWDCWLRVARNHQVACVKEVLVIQRIGHAQISSKLSRIIKGTERIIQKHGPYMTSSILSKHLAQLAAMKLNLSFAEGWKTAWSAIRVNPVLPKLYLALLLSLLGKRLYRIIYFNWKKILGDLYVGQSEID